MKKLLEYKNLIMVLIVLVLLTACFMPANETTEEAKSTCEYSENIK